MIRGSEFHFIIDKIFEGDVQNLNVSEQIQVNCPKCQEREGLYSPDGKYNLEINTNKRVFRCWKCEEPRYSGSLGRLIKQLGDHSDYVLYRELAADFHEYSEKEDEKEYITISLPNEFISFKNIDLNNHMHKKAFDYMVIERKISEQDLNEYNVGFCIEGKYRNRIIIPSYDNEGELNYFVGRSFIKKQKPPYLNPKVPKDDIIFNEGRINWDSTVYLVEGVFEYFSFQYNSIVMLGKRITKKLFFKLKEKKPNVVIFLDPDAYESAIEIYNTIENMYGGDDKIRLIKMTGNDDLDEIRRKKGSDVIRKIVRNQRKLNEDDFFFKNKYYVNDNYSGRTYSKNH